jgi:hypothetical protein
MAQIKDDFNTLMDMFSGADWGRYMTLRAWVDGIDAKPDNERSHEEKLVAAMFRNMIQLSEISPNENFN